MLAASTDQPLVETSWCDPVPRPQFIYGCLMRGGATTHLAPVICLDMVNLAADRAHCQPVLQPYLNLGLPVVCTSAVSGEGVAQLCGLLCGQTTVLAGMSGVGESSLPRAVQAVLSRDIGPVSMRRHEGWDMTSRAVPLRLPREAPLPIRQARTSLGSLGALFAQRL